MLGLCDTSLGPALFVEKIPGEDEKVAPTLQEFLEAINDNQPRFDAFGKDAEGLFDDP